MDILVRGAFMYVAVWAIFRLSGRRSFSQMTTFDFVLILIVAECTQQALLGDDFSLTNGALLVLTLVTIDLGLSVLKQRAPRVEHAMDGLPMVIVVDGQPLHERMNHERVDVDDVLESAREMQGLEQLDEIHLAVLERNGAITIVPKQKDH